MLIKFRGRKERGRKEGRKGGREGGREEGRKEGRKEGREGGRKELRSRFARSLWFASLDSPPCSQSGGGAAGTLHQNSAFALAPVHLGQ